MKSIQCPRPLRCTCSEHKSGMPSIKVPIHCQMVSRCAVSVSGSVVEEIVSTNAVSGCREVKQTRGPETIVRVNIPLVPQKIRIRRVFLVGGQICRTRIAPESHFAISRWNLNLHHRARPIDEEYCA